MSESNRHNGRSSMNDNISFDKNTQVISALRLHEQVPSKQSHASQFTFNSTDKIISHDYRDSQYDRHTREKKSLATELGSSTNKSRVRMVLSGPNTYEGNTETKLDQNEFPIMNSVRQVIQGYKGNKPDQAKNYYDDRYINAYQSKESTQVIRERLKNKIESLREKLSSSHNDTIRSTQERFNIPVGKFIMHPERSSMNIDTMRVHSRDGSKSIEGSGLELDEYVSLEDPHLEQKYSYVDKGVPISSKYETFNTGSHHEESMKSGNTYSSMRREAERIKDNRSNHNSIDVVVQDKKKHYNTKMSTKKLDEFFTIEDVRQNDGDLAWSASMSKNREKNYIDKSYSKASASKHHSNSSKRQAVNALQSLSKSGRRLLNKNLGSRTKKNVTGYSTTSSYYRTDSKSRSNSKRNHLKGVNRVILKSKNQNLNNTMKEIDKSGALQRYLNIYFIILNSYSDENSEISIASDYYNENLPPNSINESLHYGSKKVKTNVIPPYSMIKRINK